jgi:glycosyltransferase involved in cell wall biosynthesis
LTVSSEALVRCFGFNGVPEEKMAVVPNGVTLEDFGVEDREATRKKLGLEGRFVVGFVGSFQPWHRVDLLLEAVAVQCTPTPIHLLLVGEGVGREATEVHAVRLGIAERITATGSLPRSEIPTVLAACDIGALPGSNDYGQPMKLVEYAAAGLPVVAPDLAPVRESLQNGRTGLLFPPGNARALSEAIARLASDVRLRTRLGEAARESVRERTWVNSATRMEKALAAVSFPGKVP